MRAIFDCLFALLLLVNAHQPRPPVSREPARVQVSRGAPRTSHPAVGPCGGWRWLVERYDWPVDWACRVLVCESGGRPGARNGRYVGLMQVGGGSTDPERNVAQAHQMWLRRGTQPWECK